jgi:hypothetical protein
VSSLKARLKALLTVEYSAPYYPMGKSGLSLTFPKYSINQVIVTPCVTCAMCLAWVPNVKAVAL